MSGRRKRWIDYAVYVAVRLAVAIVQAVPFKAACAFARFLAEITHWLDRRHRRVADENLRLAFPGRWTDAERARIVRRVYHHFCQVVMEILHLPRMVHLTNWRQFVRLEGAEKLLSCLLSERPTMLVTGHYGNWELGGYILGLLGLPTYAVARPLDNPYVDDFLRQLRERTGQKLLAKKGDFDQMQQILAAGGTLATLADQDAGPRGLFVDFFGRPASTHKAIALMALDFNVPLAVLLVRNTGRPMCYEVDIEQVLYPEHYQNRSDASRALTQDFTEALERGIRKDPEQYLWLHRRWKSEPAKSKRQKARA